MIDRTKARLLAHGAAQPCLIVKDMKFVDSEGAVTLFVAPGAEGYFANFKLRSEAPRFCFVCERAHGVLVIRAATISFCQLQIACGLVQKSIHTETETASRWTPHKHRSMRFSVVRPSLGFAMRDVQ